MSSVLDAYVVLARRLRCKGLDALRGSSVALSATSSTISVSLGGVDSVVSESVLSSVMLANVSPLLRGLDIVVKFVLICGAISVSGARLFFGSQGIGLFGSLEAQLGIDLCLCAVIVVENDCGLLCISSSLCGTDISSKLREVMV